MKKLIKYAIVGLAGYQLGQLTIKYQLVKYALDAKSEKEKESKKEDEAQ
jgi:hypothetical protein